MDADSLVENTPKANLSAQAQKFWISIKKGFIGRPLSVGSFKLTFTIKQICKSFPVQKLLLCTL